MWLDGQRTKDRYAPHGDELIWIDAGSQLADCLTKSTRPDHLMRVLASGEAVISGIDRNHSGYANFSFHWKQETQCLILWM